MKNEYKPQELKGLKIFCLCAAMIMLGGGLAFAIVVIGLTPQFLTDQDCLALQNESFINGGQIGFNQGLLFWAKAVSDRVIQFDEMPIYYQINETTIGWEIINLTEYYLNKIGGK